ncbi:MAG: UDP-N-acetylmuramoyl-tripeptide--D-alanyl-D-alanine ligase [Roseomonas sp.]|nr:UDP-N-acetylmuramoyl-tripeptide--D-alanyl-D-alanine ligase [Roseomonas sp.]MCA3327406.1 UDP-N-acetylmuramoyl-tripeptide--D-alanyl-D-alanine ligase [Roseomonas sp.]MCA3330622.1 UDP-N-acetylmuramoyl-tripeptide--D-alanyl-D-alanine ligase [Roseomonas sp.]MCA3333210.1 UDP-N-acetylmuramoyl-tripeptide--D-alanyl-D-alanine ligase [Roseomonas sp.]MCA3347230.1 UDP-N-acetylmuramoyl-tripeptide--D-alanyl-D-alanine ligase [Roseomonas sp.]
MTALWTSAELRAATNGALAADGTISGVSIDSRSVTPGDLFIALRDQRDGHDFVADALARGALLAMVDHTPPGAVDTAKLLRVANTLAGLTALGAAGRARALARVVGVTGSVGKTTTKEMLRVAFSAFGATHASAASHNNHWGVPLTLARLPRDAAFAVIEMGMNNRGEIAPLSRLSRPDIGIITSIGTAHIGQLGSQAAIAAEKGDIISGIAPGGTAILPADSAFLPELMARARGAGLHVMTHGEAEGADARLVAYQASATGGVAEITLDGQCLTLHLAAPGRHVAQNACAVLAAVKALGLAPDIAAHALRDFTAGAGRGAMHRIRVAGGDALLIDDSYNASVASVCAGLAVLAAQPAKRRIFVFGDMLELGTEGPAQHAALAEDARKICDLVFCCGPLSRHLFQALPAAQRGGHFPDSSALAAALPAALKPGDAVLVKGSLGSRMSVIIKELTAGEQVS